MNITYKQVIARAYYLFLSISQQAKGKKYEILKSAAEVMAGGALRVEPGHLPFLNGARNGMRRAVRLAAIDRSAASYG